MGGDDERFIHVEAQMTPDAEFRPAHVSATATGAATAGRSPWSRWPSWATANRAWRVSEHREGELESQTVYRFRAVKLLDLRPRMAELEAGQNLFGLFPRGPSGDPGDQGRSRESRRRESCG